MYGYLSRLCFAIILLLGAFSGRASEFDDIISEQRATAPPVIRKEVAVLHVLNKVSGRSNQILIKVKEKAVFEDLEIQVLTCQERPPEFVPESGAFLNIREISTDKEIFSGWMFASSPSLSPFEHALFDLYIVDCRGVGEAVSQEVLRLDPRDIKIPPPKQ